MDLTSSAKTEKLRADLRALIAAEAPKIHLRNGTRVVEDADEWAAWRKWSARLYEKQYVGRSWPEAYGGVAGNTPLDEFTVASELARLRAPPLLFFATYAAHAVINFGTEDQRRRFLPPTRTSEIVWCQLFSEPGGGSDLAALRTRAVRRGDAYIINGQKVWNTQAQMADWGFLLARTGAEGSKHGGITAFLINMRQKGVDVRPIREITGTEDFNEVFFSDAEIPVADRIGEEGEGWKIATSTLAKERINTASYGVATRNAMDDLLALARKIKAQKGALPDGYRHRLASLHAACQASNLLGLVIATREQAGKPRLADPPVAKAYFSEVNLAVATLALDLLGEAGLYEEGDVAAVDAGRWSDMFYYARAYTIAGGSSEIIRNILSERVLGLPRTD
jgi:alkylation response protein AidB-like acyl-CoA dehydrogenase